MSDSTAQTLRQLKIKTGVVNRLFKEEQTYEQEVTAAQGTLDKLKSEGADGADIRNAERVVQDSQQMVPRTRKSLEEAVQSLEDLVEALKSESEIKDTEEFGKAFAALQQVQTSWKADGN